MNQKNEEAPKVISECGNYAMGDAVALNMILPAIVRAEKQYPGFKLMQIIPAHLVQQAAKFSLNKSAPQQIEIFVPLLKKV